MRAGVQQPLKISQREARRLAIVCQHLSTPRKVVNEENLMGVLRSLRYLQLDPINVVAPSHELVLWSRIGSGAVPLLNNMLWEKRTLFEYWVSSAALVLMEDYPMYRAFMNAFPPYRDVKEWMDVNESFRQYILALLQEKGPLQTSGFEDRSMVDWKSSGWTSGRNVERMLEFLWLGGEVMVSSRVSGERVWSLTESHLPIQVDRTALPMDLAIDTAVEHSVRALGVARESDVRQYFFRLYSRPPLRAAFDRLQQERKLIPIELDGDPSRKPWFIHADKIKVLDAIQAGDWEGRTTLLSPFDNLISDRERTERLFGFFFRNEMYVPKEKRQYGYYIMPILHGDQLIGRIVPKVDRRHHVLHIEGIYIEPDIPLSTELYRSITEQINELATYANASAVEYSNNVPDTWHAKLLRS